MRGGSRLSYEPVPFLSFLQFSSLLFGLFFCSSNEQLISGFDACNSLDVPRTVDFVPMVSCVTRNGYCRAAVIHYFCLEGVLTGVWASQLPNIQKMYNLSDSVLGISVLLVYFGTVVVMPLGSFVIRKCGSKWATVLGAFMYSLALGVMGFMDRTSLLMISMFAFGFTMGLMDVSMNAAGILAEVNAKTPIMGSFHGSYSIAAAIGSLLGPALHQVFPVYTTFVVVALIAIVTNMVAGNALYNSAQENEMAKKNDTLDTPSPSSCVIPTGSTLYLCAVGFLGSFGEGGMVSWSIIYFKRVLDASASSSSLGFMAFMIFMAVGRFSCDKLREKFGRQVVLRVGGGLAFTGMGLMVVAANVDFAMYVAVAGACITGAGLSTVVPTVFSTAGHLADQHVGTAIATVAAFTYSGSIVSPFLIGSLSQEFHSLQLALLVAACLLFFILPLSFGVPPEYHEEEYALLIDDDCESHHRVNVANSIHI